MAEKITTEEFIARARAVHGDRYDYSKTVYVSMFDKIIIVCKEHGEFTQKPANHIHCKQGCPACKQQGLLLTKEEIQQRIDRFVEIYRGKFDPTPFKSIVRYKDPVTLVCPDHGPFSTNMNLMLHPRTKYGCPACGALTKGNHKELKPLSQFVNEAVAKHGNKYSYARSVYLGAYKNIEIICPIHGSFFQTPGNHLSGTNCPKCARFPAVSKEETNLYKSLSEHISLKANDRSIISPLELDMVCHDHKVAVEYCGIYWHSDGKNTPPDHHYRKFSMAAEQGYRLFTVFSDEWRRSPDAVISAILRSTSSLPKIPIVRCTVEPLSVAQACAFYQKNSVILPDRQIRGASFGLYDEGTLVAAATVVAGVIVFSAKLNFFDLSGGTREFIGSFPQASRISLDLRWNSVAACVSEGLSIQQTPPSFYYTRGDVRRDNDYLSLENCLGVPASPDVMRNRGWFRIYDCGHVIAA